MRKILIAIVIVAALAVVVTMAQGDHYKEFMKTATRTAGSIVSKEDRADPETKRKEYWVTYSYGDGQGDTHTTQTSLEYPDLWQKLREGQVEMVYYDKNNPSESYLASVLERRMGMAAKLSVKTNH